MALKLLSHLHYIAIFMRVKYFVDYEEFLQVLCDNWLLNKYSLKYWCITLTMKKFDRDTMQAGEGDNGNYALINSIVPIHIPAGGGGG